MSAKCVPPQTPLIYAKTGVCMGYTYFSYFCAKTYVLSKNGEDVEIFLLIFFFNFFNLRKVCILHGHVFVMLERQV